MDTHGVREAKARSVWCTEVGVSDHLERAKAAIVQLPGGAAGDDVTGIQPYTVARQEAGRGEPVPVGVRGVALLGCNGHGPRAAGTQVLEAIPRHGRGCGAQAQGTGGAGWRAAGDRRQGRRGAVGRAAGAWQAGALRARVRVSVTARWTGACCRHGQAVRADGRVLQARERYGCTCGGRARQGERARAAGTARRTAHAASTARRYGRAT